MLYVLFPLLIFQCGDMSTHSRLCVVETGSHHIPFYLYCGAWCSCGFSDSKFIQSHCAAAINIEVKPNALLITLAAPITPRLVSV